MYLLMNFFLNLFSARDRPSYKLLAFGLFLLHLFLFFGLYCVYLFNAIKMMMMMILVLNYFYLNKLNLCNGSAV